MAHDYARPPKLRPDDIFFPAMALVILAVVVIGFAQSYFLQGLVLAKLPNKLVHIHGAIFVSWIFLLVIQNGLIAARKIRWHIALGVFGVILPPMMVVFGVLTLFDSIRRAGTGLPAGLLLAGDLEELALFAVLIAWAMIVRRTPAAHKRLMIMGTLAIVGPAVNRWPFSEAMRLPGTIAVILGLPLLVVAYDVWSLRRPHRTTIIGTACIWIMALTLIPISQMSFWNPLIRWIGHN
jgi:uncharacterized membrane protein YozB (DUF420 family)